MNYSNISLGFWVAAEVSERTEACLQPAKSCSGYRIASKLCVPEGKECFWTTSLKSLKLYVVSKLRSSVGLVPFLLLLRLGVWIWGREGLVGRSSCRASILGS
jgi:hypothetical protein